MFRTIPVYLITQYLFVKKLKKMQFTNVQQKQLIIHLVRIPCTILCNYVFPSNQATK